MVAAKKVASHGVLENVDDACEEDGDIGLEGKRQHRKLGQVRKMDIGRDRREKENETEV